MTAQALFVSWAPDNGRSRDLAAALEIEIAFVGERILHPPSAIPRYLAAALRSWLLIRRLGPKLVIVMVPPPPAAIIGWLAARGLGARLALDLHTGAVIHSKWRWLWPLVRWICRRADLTLVTTEGLADQLRQQGIQRVLAVHDPPGRCMNAPPAQVATGYVLIVAGWDTDEPVHAVLSATRALPDIRFRWTGVAPSWVRRSAPPNVELTGWQPRAHYEQMLAAADVVVCLTRSESTMQRGGYEALAAHRPLVTSGTQALREFFADAAIYVDLGSASIAAGIGEARHRGAELSASMALLHDSLRREWPSRLAELRLALGLERREAERADDERSEASMPGEPALGETPGGVG